MKKNVFFKAFFMLLFLSGLHLNTTSAQSNLSPVLTQSLNDYGTQLMGLIQSSGNDVSSFTPTLEQYEQVINAYPYRRADERQTNLDNMQTAISSRSSFLQQHLQKTRQEANIENVDLQNLELYDVKIEVKHNLDNFKGGNAVFVFRDSEGNLHRLGASAIYNIDGAWYVLNKFFWL